MCPLFVAPREKPTKNYADKAHHKRNESDSPFMA